MMDNRHRYYHRTDHVLDVATDNNPILSLAGLYHDVVQNNIDQGYSCFVEKILNKFIIFSKDKIKIRSFIKKTTVFECVRYFLF